MKKAFGSFILSALTTAATIVGTASMAQAGEWACFGEVPTIWGTSGDDVIYVGSGDHSPGPAQIVSTGGGNDVIYGDWATGTMICGGAGDDKIYGGDGVDTLHGGPGNDLVRGGGGDDVLDEVSGSNSMYGDSGNDVIYGGAERDSIYGGEGSDKIHGNESRDMIAGQGGSDELWGDDGNDFLFGGAGGHDVLRGGYGNDGLHDDNEAGAYGDVYGEAGDDTLEGSGNVYQNGGTGWDSCKIVSPGVWASKQSCEA
jgi:Ca2+-binding RTX toxin-like protein